MGLIDLNLDSGVTTSFHSGKQNVTGNPVFPKRDPLTYFLNFFFK